MINRWLTSAAVLFSIATGQSGCGEHIDGNGKLETRSYEVGKFDGVRNTAPLALQLQWQAGAPTTKPELQCDSNLLDQFSVRVVEGMLEIEMADDATDSFSTQLDCSLSASVSALVSLENNSSEDVFVRGAVEGLTNLANRGHGEIHLDSLRTAQLNLDNSGDAGVHIAELDTDMLSVHNSGHGDIQIAKGRATKANYALHGDGAAFCKDVASEEVSLVMAGHGDAHVTATQSVSITLSGDGSVDVWGSPADRSELVTGHGEVRYH